MARYKQSYAGEHLSVKQTLKMTPSQAAELKAAAEKEGATVSEFARELVFRRLGTPGLAAGVCRNPQAASIMRAMMAAAYEHSANGNNLNQIARHLNMTGEIRDWPELREVIGLQQKAAALHIEALERVLAL